MDLFGSDDTVDQKAAAALDDLGSDPTPREVGRAVGEIAARLNVDPDTVAQKMRDHDDGGVLPDDDQDRRDAAAAVAAKRDGLDADEVLAVLNAAESRDADAIAEALGEALDPDQTAPDQQMSDGTPDDDTSTDQKATDDGGGGDMDVLDLVEQVGGDDTRETVEEYADAVGIDPEDAAADWVAENVPGVSVDRDNGDGGDAPEGDTAPNANAGGGTPPADPDRDRQADQMGGGGTNAGGAPVDQNLEARVADAVTSDRVIDELAGEVSQKLASDEDLADELVETVDKKGDFATTDDITHSAPTDDAETVDEAGALTGGDDA